jgi:hypothetical protein
MTATVKTEQMVNTSHWNKNRSTLKLRKILPQKDLWTMARQKSRAVQKFHLFSQLPVEIRYKIWHLIVDDSATLVCGLRYPRLDPTRKYFRKVPVILQVCRETRQKFTYETGVTKWHAAYSLCSGLSPNPYRHDVRLYANMKKDIVLGKTNRKILIPLIIPCLYGANVA